MRITIGAIGKLKSGPEFLLVQRYIERVGGIGRSCGISNVRVIEIAESRDKTAVVRKRKEAGDLLAAAPKNAFFVCLDQTGRRIDSQGFADRLGHWRGDGVSELVFVIGGPDGHGEQVRKQAGFMLSLGDMTWPHRLARVMLAEQLYRAVTLMINHPYHRD